MGQPFQMGSGGGLVPRGGNRQPQNQWRGSSGAMPGSPMAAGQFGPQFGSPPQQGGFSGAVQGAMQGIGPGGVQAGPDPTMRVQRPVLPQPVQEPMGPGDQAPNQYQGMTGSEIFARLFGQRP